MRPARAQGKRCIYLEAIPAPEGKKSFGEKFSQWVHGEVRSLGVEIDGESVRTLYVGNDLDPLRLDLDERSHVVRLTHSALKPNYPTVTVPAGRGYYAYTADGNRGFQLRCVDKLPPIPPVNYTASATTARILDDLVRGLQSGGRLLRELRENESVAFLWLECDEVGFDIHFFPNGERTPPQSLSYAYDDFASFTGGSSYTALPTDQAVGLEHYLIRQLKQRLSNIDELEIYRDNEFYCIRLKADIEGSLTTRYICEDLAEDWRVGGWLYRDLHHSDVSYAQMEIAVDGIYVYFMGYPGEHKYVPPRAVLPYSHFSRGKGDYHALNEKELALLKRRIVEKLNDDCDDDIVLRPVEGNRNAWDVIDLHKYV